MKRKMPKMALDRLQKVLAHMGVASRRGAEEMIADGRITVNGKKISTPGVKVDPEEDAIEVDGKLVTASQEEKIVILLNKPVGYTSTVSDPHAEHTIMELVEVEGKRLYPVGRLDKESRGMIFLTDDGDLAHKLTHPSFGVEKTYRVNAWGDIGQAEMEKMASGVELEDGMTAPAKVENVRIDGTKVRFTITITEGRKRQIRMMLRALGGRVSDLRRTNFAGLELGVLPEGAWRQLGRKEVAALRRRVDASAKKAGKR